MIVPLQRKHPEGTRCGAPTGASSWAVVLAAGFYLLMLTMAARANDPVALMQTVGEVSGVAGGLSVVMIIFGLIGRKTP